VITVKSGDRYPITLTVNMDLTSATVKLTARNRDDKTAQTLTATVADAVGGTVTHTLTGTLAVGAYDLELEITQGSSIYSAPTAGYERLVVAKDLA